MLSEAQMVALTRRYQLRLAAISTTGGTAVARAWDELGSYDRGDVPRYTDRTSRLYQAAKAAALATAAGFYSLLATVPPPALVPADVELVVPVDDPFIAYWQALKAGHQWIEAQEIGRNRADASIGDYVTSTSRRTGDLVAESTGQEIVGWRRVLTGTSCAWCATVATQRYRTSESADFGHTRCVVGSTMVVSPTARSLSCRWYRGELVVVGTTAGNELTVTPNHPVLTNQGWVLAGELREGMYLFRGGSQHGQPVGVPHEDDMPACIEERFRANRVAGSVMVPFAAEDFHGDRGDGEVNVVPAHGLFDDRTLTKLDEPPLHLLLTSAPGTRPGHPRLCRTHDALLRLGYPSQSTVGRGRLPLAVLAGHPAGSIQASLRTATGGNSVRDEVLPDNGSTYPKPGFERQLGLPSEIELDRVAQLRRIGGRCHVFNLHTSSGWYFANGIVVHNCDCTAVPIYGDSDPGRIINRPVLSTLKEKGEGYWKAGYVNPDGTPAPRADATT